VILPLMMLFVNFLRPTATLYVNAYAQHNMN
jgi:hypothetical protein